VILSEDDKCALDLALRHAIERNGGDSCALEAEAKRPQGDLVGDWARLALQVYKSRETMGYAGGVIEITEGVKP
jgi:hypothetical protein